MMEGVGNDSVSLEYPVQPESLNEENCLENLELKKTSAIGTPDGESHPATETNGLALEEERNQSCKYEDTNGCELDVTSADKEDNKCDEEINRDPDEHCLTQLQMKENGEESSIDSNGAANESVGKPNVGEAMITSSDECSQEAVVIESHDYQKKSDRVSDLPDPAIDSNVNLNKVQENQENDVQIIEPPAKNENLNAESAQQKPSNLEVSVCYRDERYLAQLRSKKKGEEFFIDSTGALTDSVRKPSSDEESSSDECSKEGNAIESHDYRNKSGSSVSDLSDLATDSDVEIELEEIFTKESVHTQPVCHGELSLKDLPPIEDLRITVPEAECLKVGTVSSIVNELVVVQALPNTPALNLGTVLFLNFGKDTLGIIFDVFGQVKEPYYAIRFNSEEHARSRGVSEGVDVFCAPKTPHTSFVFVSEIMQKKGSDASWEHNNEPPVVCLDYSDDEEERNARKRHNQRKGVNLDSSSVQRKSSVANVADNAEDSFNPHMKGSIHSGYHPGCNPENGGPNLPFVERGCARRSPVLPYPAARMPSSPFGPTSVNNPFRSCLLPNPFQITVPPPSISPRMTVRQCPRMSHPRRSLPYWPIQTPPPMPPHMSRTHPPGHPPVLFSQSQNFNTFHHALGHTKPIGFDSFPHQGFMPNVRQGLLPTPCVSPRIPAAGPGMRPPHPHDASPPIPQMDRGFMNPHRGFPVRRSRFHYPSFGTCMQSHSGQRDNHLALRPNSFQAVDSVKSSPIGESGKPSQSVPSSESGQSVKPFELRPSSLNILPSGDKGEEKLSIKPFELRPSSLNILPSGDKDAEKPS